MVLSWTKSANFLQKNALKLHIDVYLRAKFEVSSIILTSFRQGGNFTPPPPQNESLKSPPRLGLNSSKHLNWISLMSYKKHLDDSFYRNELTVAKNVFLLSPYKAHIKLPRRGYFF